jgi:hypothetical protein
VLNEENLNSLHHKEDKEMKNIFHVNIKINKEDGVMFDYISKENLIAEELVSKLGLEI